MIPKLQERWYFLLALLDAIHIVWTRMRRQSRDLLHIIIATVDLLFDVELLKNKFYAILLILCTLPVVFLEGDATATVFITLIAIPMFFAKEPWIY